MAERTLSIEVPASDVLHMRIVRSQAARDVLAERQRQIQQEGWTPEHDDEHGDGAMAYAAAAYAVASVEKPGTLMKASALFMWTGWAKSWWKPKDRRSDLIRAGALILAEIERLDRAAGASGVTVGDHQTERAQTPMAGEGLRE